MMFIFRDHLSAFGRMMLFNLKDTINFDKAVKRQGICANSKARMTTGITKGINHQIRCAIHDCWLAVKIISRGNKGTKFDNARNAIQITSAGNFDLGNQIDRANTRLFSRILRGGIFANGSGCCQFAINKGT